MNIPHDRLYTKDHEWIACDNATGLARVGITEFAQDALGDVVFVQLPTVGTKVQSGMSMSEVESTKSVSDIYAPIDGVITQVNENLSESPQLVNEDPYGKGWICVIEPTADAGRDHLLDAAAYGTLANSETGH